MLFFIEKLYQGRVRNIKKSFVHLTWYTLGFSSKCLALSTKNQILYDYFRVYLEPISRLILTVSDTYVGSLYINGWPVPTPGVTKLSSWWSYTALILEITLSLNDIQCFIWTTSDVVIKTFANFAWTAPPKYRADLYNSIVITRNGSSLLFAYCYYKIKHNQRIQNDFIWKDRLLIRTRRSFVTCRS